MRSLTVMSAYPPQTPFPQPRPAELELARRMRELFPDALGLMWANQDLAEGVPGFTGTTPLYVNHIFDAQGDPYSYDFEGSWDPTPIPVKVDSIMRELQDDLGWLESPWDEEGFGYTFLFDAGIIVTDPHYGSVYDLESARVQFPALDIIARGPFAEII